MLPWPTAVAHPAGRAGARIDCLFFDGLEKPRWPCSDTNSLLPGARDGNLIAAFVRVADHMDELHPAERELVAQSTRPRALAFSSGRRAAKFALAEIGLEHRAVGAKGRAPAWPKGVVGSITHSRVVAAAVVARSASWTAVGVDLTPQGRVSASVAERVLCPGERRALPNAEWRTAVFSAKESVYKAANPVCGEFLAFRDVRIAIDADSTTFTAATTRGCASSTLIAAGEGRLLRYGGHWLTVFAVANG